MKLIVTNEHGGNHIPKAYEFLFLEKTDILASPKACDIGSIDIYKALYPIADFHLGSKTSRLLVDLNRSVHHPRVFSAFSKKLSHAERDVLLDKYYMPYRGELISEIEKNRLIGESTLHIGVHTFAVLSKGDLNAIDIAMLYDPKKIVEHRAAVLWKKELLSRMPDLHIRFNFPVNGATDGLPPNMRKAFPEAYAGIELLVNQKMQHNAKFSPKLKQALKDSLSAVMQRL